jgi:hypothetical protein
VESIKPEAIERGMVLVDETNDSAYTVLDTQLTLTGSYYVKGLALTNWGSLIQKNFTYLAEDGELFVVARPAPFALPALPAREPSDAETHSFPGDAPKYTGPGTGLVIDGGDEGDDFAAHLDDQYMMGSDPE